MKTIGERLKIRLSRDRKMTTISIRMPEDVIDDLKEIAPMLGFSGYQPLIRAYVGQGLRDDLTRLENTPAQRLTDSLRQQGVAEEVISLAIAEAGLGTVRRFVSGPPAEPDFAETRVEQYESSASV